MTTCTWDGYFGDEATAADGETVPPTWVRVGSRAAMHIGPAVRHLDGLARLLHLLTLSAAGQDRSVLEEPPSCGTTGE